MARPWKMHASAGPASLAPMVRLGTLPLRLLALERGAALVYSEEIVDTKLAQATRTVHAQSGTVEWRLPSGAVLLSTLFLIISSAVLDYEWLSVSGTNLSAIALRYLLPFGSEYNLGTSHPGPAFQRVWVFPQD